MVTGPGIIVGIASVFGFIAVYYAFGGEAPFGVKKEDDDPSQEGWPFHAEKVTSDRPFKEKPVPEYPVWMDRG